MMSKIEKLIRRFLSNPTDFEELTRLLRSFGYEELKSGKTGGSRRAFLHSKTKHLIRLHQPHPSKILKRYQLTNIIEELRKEGIL